METQETLGAVPQEEGVTTVQVLQPIIDPGTDEVLEQRIAIPYTTTIPSFTPRVDGIRRIYYDSSSYWLYVYANGGWRSIKLSTVSSSAARTHRATSTQTINDLTTTKVQLNTNTFTPVGLTVDITTDYRITVVTAGKYMITGQVTLAGSVDGKFLQANIRVNNSAVATNISYASVSSASTAVNVSTVIDAGVGDYIELWVIHDIGSPTNISANSNENYLCVYGTV